MPSTDLPALEREVAASWARSGLAGRLAVQRSRGPCPPLATEPFPAWGVPGTQESGPRTINDVYFRFKTMRGYRVPPRTGLDCHGLGVEVAVARELGLASPGEIRAYGVASFVTRCRESALRHASDRYAGADRLGWLGDTSPALRTMDAGYIDRVWRSLASLFDAGLLRRDQGTGPYCPRCQVRLAEHELRRPGVFRPVKCTALVVRFRLEYPSADCPSSRFLRDADLLVWTSAPWTLAAFASVTVEGDETYAVAGRAGKDERVVVAESHLYRVLGDGWHVVARVRGSDLAGVSCRLPFPRGGEAATGRVVLATSPAGRTRGLAEPDHPVGPDGRFGTALPGLHGIFFADADPVIATELADRGLLFSAAPWEISRPHCWRCASPLLTRAGRSWYLTVGSGQDWALSRDRYWGTPLPFWECHDGHLTRAGSVAELSELAGRDLSGIDPHYPALAGLRIRCSPCGGPSAWVAETLDPSYDAGLMPFAQHGDVVVKLAAGDRDQAASWHYAATVLGRLLYGREPARASTWTGRVVDARGRDVSRNSGNQADPLPLIERHGADAVRWYWAALPPRQARAGMPDAALNLIMRQVLIKYLNIVRYFVQRSVRTGTALPSERKPGDPVLPDAPVLDRWLVSESQVLTAEVTAALDAFRCDTATRRLASFIRDVSCWYLPLSRAGSDGQAMLTALSSCLDVLTRLMAPFAPFLADHCWNLIRGQRGQEPADSVHLEPWPEVFPQLIDLELGRQMKLARHLVKAGRAARATALIPARQTLSRAWLPAEGYSALDTELLALVAAELNVRSVQLGPQESSRVVLDLDG